jgi:hypothetical protein
MNETILINGSLYGANGLVALTLLEATNLRGMGSGLSMRIHTTVSP